MPSAYTEHSVIEHNEVEAYKIALRMPRRTAFMDIETLVRASMKDEHVQKR
jgi:hypothetical protein